MQLLFPAPAPVTLPVQGSDARFPVRRVYCVGRNYAEHAREFGHDPDREPPFFFMKPADTLRSDGIFPYPPQSQDVHYEIELALMIGTGGRDIPEAQASAHIFGYATALDMTRRDLQAVAKKAGRPWEAAKSFDHSAPVTAIVPADQAGDLTGSAITLSVNGALRQQARIGDMIWSAPGIVAQLSTLFELFPGDVILTGTPAGVGAVVPGDVMEGRIDGLPVLTVTVT